jgi:hypothetical protein
MIALIGAASGDSTSEPFAHVFTKKNNKIAFTQDADLNAGGLHSGKADSRHNGKMYYQIVAR